MRCEITSDPDAFWTVAAEFLLADPIVNNVTITNVLSRRSGALVDPAPPTFLSVHDGDRVVGAAMRTPPHAVYLSPLPSEAIPLVVDALTDACPDAVGVTATVDEAGTFARAWGERTGQAVTQVMGLRIHRLDTVVPPPSRPRGSLRLATKADLDRLAGWEAAFRAEAEPPTRTDPLTEQALAEARRHAELRIEEGRAWLWDDGTPVSYAGTTHAVEGVVRIGPVYTPPEHRRRGYATALVATLSQCALDAGASACVLYTDLANPTSNKVYAAVGYRPVCDVADYRFGAEV
jgi:predicted GNAT family acetyltransferase